MQVCGYAFNVFLDMVKNFHGSTAPGIVLGGVMIDHALKNLPHCEFYDCICETAACLPDAVQILTPCTAGNGWMHVVDHGKFALTLFEKEQGRGIRVYVDTKKLGSWGEVNAWFHKLKPKPEQDFDLLLRQIAEGGGDFLSLEEVNVDLTRFEKKKKGKTISCPRCGEAFPLSHGEECRRCQGDDLYL